MRRLLARFLNWILAEPEKKQKEQLEDGGIAEPAKGVGRIHDGILYWLPPVMPDSIRRAGPEAQKAFMEASDPFRTQFGSPYVQGSPFKQLTYADPLTEWDITTRRYVLEQCHLAWERNPLANACVAYTRMFAVQNGFSTVYKNEAVEQVLEAFIEDNGVRDYDKSLLDCLIVDGELFIRIFGDEPPTEDGDGDMSGQMTIVPLPPWGIQYIKTDINNRRNVISYGYQVAQTDGAGKVENVDDDVPASQMLHVAINRLPYEQRGRPDLFRILPWLGGYREFLENRARLNAFSGVAYHDKVATNNAKDIAAVIARWKKPLMPGAFVVTSDKEDIIAMAHNIDAMGSAEDGRQFKLMIAVGATLPEYFLSDGSNANLASATAQQLPALRKFGEYQDIMRDQLWMPLFKRCLRLAIDRGVLLEMVEEQRADGTVVTDEETGLPHLINALDAFDLVYPELEGADPAVIINALLQANNANLISDQTTTGLLPWPVDYHEEQERIASEREKTMNDMAQGLIPTPPPFGAQPANVQQQPEGEAEYSNG